MNDPRSFRKPRIDSIPISWILLEFRETLFEDRGQNYARTMALLRSAAKRKSEEATWILNEITLVGTPLENFPTPYLGGTDTVHPAPSKELTWMENIMRGPDARSKFYRAGFLRLAGGDYEPLITKEILSLLEESAKTGYAPALCELGVIKIDRGDRQEGFAMLTDAFEKGDVPAKYFLAVNSKPKRILLCVEASLAGYKTGLSDLCQSHAYQSYLSASESITISARSGFLGNSMASLRRTLEIITENLEGPIASRNLENIRLCFIVGREMEGYDELWQKNTHHPTWDVLDQNFYTCIYLYLTICHRARQAALQTLVGLEEFISSDIAYLIAKHVYTTRFDCVTWWNMK